MNLYLVVSEMLTYIEWEDWTVNAGHYENYAITELVVARNNSQARYLAWQTDGDFSYDFRDMPKFRTRCQIKGVDGPARIVSDEYQGEANYWLWCFDYDADIAAMEGNNEQARD